MIDTAPTQNARASATVISIDALGAEKGLDAIIGGMVKACDSYKDIRFILHGPEAELDKLLNKHPSLRARTELRDAPTAISMDEKPSRAVRSGKGTSMWQTLETVAQKEAEVAVSCGNTGALMALAMLRLRKAPQVDRPAIAVLWPSRNPAGYNVVLDMGADIRADAKDLQTYAIMGAAYARHGLGLTRPRIGLLNVGTEEHKGRAELQAAARLIAETAALSDYEYVGFVEGSDITGKRVDVIVTDGFAGNIALKTAEGTASLIRELLAEAFKHSVFSRIGALFALTSLKRLSRRIDPRRVNGGVFLGLNGTVVKSHGSADETGIAAAIKLAYTLAHNGFSERVAARVALRDSAVAPIAAQEENTGTQK